MSQLSGISADPAKPGVLFGPDALTERVVSEPLVVNDYVYMVTANGSLLLLDISAGTSPSTSSDSLPLCSRSDTVHTPALLMNSASPPFTLFLISEQGCAAGFDLAGQRLWSANMSLSADDLVHVPPAADAAAGRGQALFVTSKGNMCCVDSKAGGQCKGWSARCVLVVQDDSQVPLSGLAVSPPSADFHSGLVYTLGSDGTLYGVSTLSGTVEGGAMPVAVPPISAAPVLVPNAWGAHNHALLVLSGPNKDQVGPTVLAISVGNSGSAVDDDDAEDDDGNAQSGLVWSVNLPPECGTTTPASGGISINDAGRVFVVCPNTIVALDAATAPTLPPGSVDLEAVVVAVCVIAAMVVIGGMGFCVYKRRVREDGEDGEDGYGGGHGGTGKLQVASQGADAQYVALVENLA